MPSPPPWPKGGAVIGSEDVKVGAPQQVSMAKLFRVAGIIDAEALLRIHAARN